MGFEKRVLNVVGEVTEIPAYFYEGTLFLQTDDSVIATGVFNKLWDYVDGRVMYCKAGTETAYDFLSATTSPE